MWVIREHIPYEGLSEITGQSTEEVIGFVKRTPGFRLEDIEIDLETTQSYSPWEFLEKFDTCSGKS